MEKTKNCWIIPTDKPSRLIIDTIECNIYLQPILHNKTVNVLPQHIYITSDEEIKVEDWCFEVHNGDSKATSPKFIDEQGNTWWLRKANANDIAGCPTTKKIILTTDQDLINDGVQKIDDEFLEWFINNPSCEEVKVEKIPYDGTKSIDKYWGGEYKIIIPKEEPLHKGRIISEEEIMTNRSSKYEFIDFNKKETLEEAAEKYSLNELSKLGFINGAKWQAERMYSEEEVEEIAKDAYAMGRNNILIGVFNKWFEQFKKK